MLLAEEDFFHPRKSDLILWPPFLWTDRDTFRDTQSVRMWFGFSDHSSTYAYFPENTKYL